MDAARAAGPCPIAPGRCPPSPLPSGGCASTSPPSTPRAALTLATDLVHQGRGAVRALVAGLPWALWGSWAAALASGPQGLDVLTTAGATPAFDGVSAPWLPLERPRRLPDRVDAAVMARTCAARRPGTRLRAARGGRAPTGRCGSAVLLGRLHGPRFLDSELRQLGQLAAVAVATEVTAAAERLVSR